MDWVGDLGAYIVGVVNQWLVGMVGGFLGILLGLLDKRKQLSWRSFMYFLAGFLVLSPFQLWREQRKELQATTAVVDGMKAARDSCVSDRERAIASARQAASSERMERYRAHRDRLGVLLMECDDLIEQCRNGPATPITESLRWVKRVESYLGSSGLDRSFLARFKGARESRYGNLPLGHVTGDVEEMLKARRRVLDKFIEELSGL